MTHFLKSLKMNKYQIFFSTKFKKDLKKFTKIPKKYRDIQSCVKLLASNGNIAIPTKMLPHKLIGKYKDCYECHILPDLLLIWEEYEEEKEIVLLRVGSHSDLF